MWGQPPPAVRSSEARRLLHRTSQTGSVSHLPALTISAQSAKITEVTRIRSSVPTSGPVAQLGARFHGMEEVVGSIPTRSTIIPNGLAAFVGITSVASL